MASLSPEIVHAMSDGAPTKRVGAGFMTGFVIAQIGAYVSFLPLLQILVPLKIEALDPLHKGALLSEIASLGALMAGLANLSAGWISDRTRSRWGRRRPWIVVGALATIVSYGFIGWANNLTALLVSVLMFQLTFNFAFAPILALIPDRVPDTQKGWMSALTGLGLPLGSVTGSVLIGALLKGEAARYGALALIVLLTIVPFGMSLTNTPEDMSALAAPRPVIAPRWPKFTHDFMLVWFGRCLVLTAYSLVQTYLLFYLQSTMHYGAARAGPPEADMARLSIVFGAANIATGLIAGRLSDRFNRRKIFVVVGALILGAAMTGLTLAQTWNEVFISYGVLGCGAGCYYAIDLALIAQVLPSTASVGRDMGVVNLSNTAPQIIAPALAGLLLAVSGADIRSLFVAAAVLASLGAMMVIPIRRVR